MNAAGRGTMGHLAIATGNVDRAVYHLGKKKVKFDESTCQYDDEGHLKFIYLADEIGGFAVHLTLKK